MVVALDGDAAPDDVVEPPEVVQDVAGPPLPGGVGQPVLGDVDEAPVMVVSPLQGVPQPLGVGLPSVLG